MLRVEIFTDRCPSCVATVEMTRAIAAVCPGIDLRVVDVRRERALARTAGVFIVPTVMIAGRVVFVGPPTRQELEAALTQPQIPGRG